MASYSSSDFKNGLKVLIDGEPFNIIDTEFHKPGKGQAFNKIKLKNLKNGKVLEFGNIEGQELIQIKNSKYNLNELLNFNSKNIQTYKDGSYITIYLAPYNYHRVHMPVDGMLLENTIIPGELHPVNEKALKSIPDLYSRNQRMVSFFQNANYEFSMIMVAALNVADINKKWSNAEIARQPVSIKQGEEYSRFNLGSTVLMIFPKECNLQWRDNLNKNQNIQLGQLLATLNK